MYTDQPPCNFCISFFFSTTNHDLEIGLKRSRGVDWMRRQGAGRNEDGKIAEEDVGEASHA